MKKTLNFISTFLFLIILLSSLVYSFVPPPPSDNNYAEEPTELVAPDNSIIDYAYENESLLLEENLSEEPVPVVYERPEVTSMPNNFSEQSSSNEGLDIIYILGGIFLVCLILFILIILYVRNKNDGGSN